jgi:hypothetical protein
VIDVCARHRERQVGVLSTRACGTRRPLRTQLDSTEKPEWPLGDVLPVPEGQPVTPLGRAAQDTHQGVQAGGVDELESGEIDDKRRRADRTRIELAVENRSCYSVKPATEPDSQRLSSASPRNHELASRDRLACVANRGFDPPQAPAVGLQTGQRERCSRRTRFRIAVPKPYAIASSAAVCRYAPVREVHAAPAVGSVCETVTKGRGDSDSCVTGVSGNAISATRR